MEQMYQDGGITMHLITLLSALAVVLLVRAGALARRGHAARTHGIILHLVVAIVFTGVFGVVDGFRQVFEAVVTVPPELQSLAMARGASLAVIPLGWGMMCATVLVLWRGVVLHRVQLISDASA